VDFPTGTRNLIMREGPGTVSPQVLVHPPGRLSRAQSKLQHALSDGF
jgi:hypothetical protein